MHFLIILQRYPSLIKNKESIEHRLADYAISYAIELAG